jgi:hypothetical protein
MNDIERALDDGTLPWVEIEYRTKSYWVFKPIGSDIEGHLIFVPITKSMPGLMDCYQAAYQFGFQGHVSKKWPKYTIIQNVGVKEIDYPFLEMVPKFN